MKIVNHTRWRTADIRAVAMRVAQEELDPRQTRAIVIEVFTKNAKGARRDRWTRTAKAPVSRHEVGLTYNYFTLTMPAVRPSVMKLTPEKREQFLAALWRTRADYRGVILAHEMAECRGKKHADMHGRARYGYRSKSGSYWHDILAPMPMHWDPPKRVERESASPAEKAQQAQGRAMQRLAKAQLMVKTWTRRHKYATTYLRKWTRRLRALERHHGEKGAAA